MTRRLLVCAALLEGILLLWAGIPLVGAHLLRVRVLPRLEARLGCPLHVGTVHLGWGTAALRSLVLEGAPGTPPPFVVPTLRAHFRLGALLHGELDLTELEVVHPRIELIHSQHRDNLGKLWSRLHERQSGGHGRSHLRVGLIRVEQGTLGWVDDLGRGHAREIDAELRPHGPGELRLGEVRVQLAAGPHAELGRVKVDFRLARGHGLAELPQIEVSDGAVVPLSGLELTGIHGSVRPDRDDPQRLDLEVHGSYRGARAELWNALGWYNPLLGQGDLKVRAARFRLSQLESVLNHEGAVSRVLNARDAEVDARLDLGYQKGQLAFTGAFHLAGLTLAHPMLGPVPVANIGFDARAHGSVDVAARTLHLAEATVDFRKVRARVTADVENLGARPRFSARLQVDPVPCQTALAALPAEMTPYLQGFKLSGTFSTDLHVGIDLGDLDQPIDLGGHVGIEGCKALQAPPLVDAKRLLGSFVQTVQVEPGHWLSFWVGPENPDWVPYAQISPYIVNSILTTEDSGFFRHRGFIPSEFRSALQQNLQRGYFRLGASSITMQMIKNVLLSREKTLSRKLQELFLTWYVEHHLTKERIIEIYFNVIEFGPGIYGIGRACHHYFGKAPADLAPQEAVWFSSILPNPKRRYAHYCAAKDKDRAKDGLLDARWQTYLRRILRRMHERGRLTDDEWARADSTPLRFDESDGLPKAQCLALVHQMTTPPVELAAEEAAHPRRRGDPKPPEVDYDWGSARERAPAVPTAAAVPGENRSSMLPLPPL